MISFASAYSDSVYIEDYDLSVEYDSAVAGDIFNLTISVVNDANSARNLTLKFYPDDPFDFITDKKWSFHLESGETATKKFRIKVDEDAEKKTYDLEFNLDDGEDDWDDSFDIKVLSGSAEFSLRGIVFSPSKIYPDSKDVKLEVTIRNKGDKNAEDLVAKIILPKGFTPSNSYSDIVYLGDFDAGESETLTFYFDVSNTLSEKKYMAEINLKYEVEGDDEESTFDLNIPVFGIPQFEITDVKVMSEEISQGSNAKIKLSVQNVGSEDAKDVSLKVYERSDRPFEFKEKSVYVGSLKSGEIGYAVFEFGVDSNAEPINYLLDFQVRSVDGDSVIVDDLTTSIKVSEKNFNIQSYFISVILGGIFVLLLSILIFVLKRGKNGS